MTFGDLFKNKDSDRLFGMKFWSEYLIQNKQQTQAQNPCYHCETIQICGEVDEMQEAKFTYIYELAGVKLKMQLCSKHFKEIMYLNTQEPKEISDQ